MGRIGRYVLLEPLGRGGVGEVHLARRDGADKSCVLKLLRMEHRSNASLLSRLKREAHLLSYLDHPHVARILDAGVERGIFYLALEYINGHTLRSIMRKYAQRGRPMPSGAALSIALAVLDGLAHAHDLRGPEGEPLDIVHRDLSPNNVMVTAAGEVKIIDFGLATGKVDRFQTTPGVVLGTLRYAAPEQAETGHVDRRSDLYTVGAVLYEMLTGAPIVTTRDPNEILDAVLSARPRSFREVAPHLPDSLWEMVRAAIALDPKDRPQDAHAFAERLRNASAGMSIFSAPLLGQTVAALFLPENDMVATLSPAPDTLAENTASEEIPGTVSVVNPRPRRRDMSWPVVALLCAVIMSMSFAAVYAMLGRTAPVVIPAVPQDGRRQ